MDPVDALSEFLAEKYSTGRAAATVLFYRNLLKSFVDFLRRRDLTDIAHLSNSDLRAFFGHLYERNASGEITRATIAAYERAVRIFCSFCVHEKWLAENPMNGRPRTRVPGGLPDTLSFEEIKALLATCGDDPVGWRDRALMLLMLDTGLRAGEVCGLTIGDLYLNEAHGTVRVRAERSKSRRERTVPLCLETVETLRKYAACRPADARTLFVSATPHRLLSTEPLTPNGLNQIMRRRAKQAGIGEKRKWCHIWRHTFAKVYVLAGGDLETLRRLLGHASLETVRIYLSFHTEEVERCHQKFSPVRQLANHAGW